MFPTNFPGFIQSRWIGWRSILFYVIFLNSVCLCIYVCFVVFIASQCAFIWKYRSWFTSVIWWYSTCMKNNVSRLDCRPSFSLHQLEILQLFSCTSWISVLFQKNTALCFYISGVNVENPWIFLHLYHRKSKLNITKPFTF